MTIRAHLDAERPLHAQLQVFALDDIAAQTWAEAAGTVGHNAITLRNAVSLRLVLLTMHAGSQLQEHDTFAPIALHVISRRVRFTTANEALELSSQMVVTLDGGISHRVEAYGRYCVFVDVGGRSNRPVSAGHSARRPPAPSWSKTSPLGQSALTTAN